MKPIKFGNKNVLQIVSNSVKSEIKNSVRSAANMEITTRSYNFLNEKNLHNLNDTDYKVCVNTFGHKYLLFLTKYHNKNYCVFINKKREDMIHVRFRFSEELFNNTLFDGELIKNNDNKYVYTITDIFSYKNECVIEDKSLEERLDILQNIIHKKYKKDDLMNFCLLDVKEYFELKYLKDIYERYIPSIPYRCSGIFLQHLENHRKSYMYIFPEFRTQNNQQNNNQQNNKNQNKEVNKKVNKEVNKEISKDVNKELEEKTSNYNELKKNNDNDDDDNIFDKNKSYNFQIKETELPDIYKLFYLNKEKSICLGYAGIPDLDTSKLLADVFDQMGNNDSVRIVVSCEYSQNFDKWIPKNITNNEIFQC